MLWARRPVLRDHGLLLPGTGPREHLWASCAVRGEPRLERRHPDAPGAWARLAEEARAWDGDVLVSHEFLCGASTDQVAAAVADLGGAEVHLVLTARELVSLVGARWQEWVKNGARGPLDGYPPREDDRPADEWGWATNDLGGILQRWDPVVPPERIHVLCPPGPGEPRDLLLQRFCGVLGVPAALLEGAEPEANASLGLTAVELMRRVNPHVQGIERPVDRGTWLRGYLAQEVLARHRGAGEQRFVPGPERVAVLRDRSERAVARLGAGGYDVVGDVGLLRTPAELVGRHPDEVGDDELLDVAARVVADLLADVREARREARAPGPAPSAGPAAAWRCAPRRAARRLLRRLRPAG